MPTEKEGMEDPDGAVWKASACRNVVYLVRAGCITSCYPPNYFVKEVGHG